VLLFYFQQRRDLLVKGGTGRAQSLCRLNELLFTSSSDEVCGMVGGLRWVSVGACSEGSVRSEHDCLGQDRDLRIESGIVNDNAKVSGGLYAINSLVSTQKFLHAIDGFSSLVLVRKIENDLRISSTLAVA
jgi:hypothetical protein